MTTRRFESPVMVALLFGAIAGCTSLTEPPASITVVAPPAESASSTAEAEPAPPPAPAPTAAPAAQGETVTASHILIAYAGAMRADPNNKRTKAEAEKRAEAILARAKKGEDFAKLADEASDDPSAKMNHGSLGSFTRERMIKPFADAAFALKPGQVSGVVETPFGFHIIKRTE